MSNKPYKETRADVISLLHVFRSIADCLNSENIRSIEPLLYDLISIANSAIDHVHTESFYGPKISR